MAHHVVAIIPEGDGRLARLLADIERADEGLEVQRSRFDFSFAPRWSLLHRLLALRRQLRECKIDAILYHLYATALAVRLTSLGLDIRRVHMVAGPLYLESVVLRTVERVMARMDDHIICGSDYISRKYRSLGLSSARLSVLPYGVSTTEFRPPSDQETVCGPVGSGCRGRRVPRRDGELCLRPEVVGFCW